MQDEAVSVLMFMMLAMVKHTSHTEVHAPSRFDLGNACDWCMQELHTGSCMFPCKRCMSPSKELHVSMQGIALFQLGEI